MLHSGALLHLTWLLSALVQHDSLATLRRAQHAQGDFEWRRGMLVPRTLAHSGGSCDERIGRFCYWYDDDRDPPVAEPEAVATARGRLLVLLDSAAALIPGDGWIAGQRVRYLVESGRPADALAAARACRAAAWWCEALDGFARHAAGDDAGAESVYDAALADMPASERCRWTDLTPLVEGELRRRFLRLGCEERAALSAHLWWLARPLFTRPGNDRRVEHLARFTMARMLEHAGSAWAESVADDLRELTLRYGWPVAWSEDLGIGPDARHTVIGHERQPAFHFFPDEDPAGDLRAPPWTLLPARPRERYAPVYAASFEALTPDVAVFRRGESTLVVVAYDLTRDTVFQGQPLEAAAVLARDERTPLVAVADSGVRGALVAVAPWPATLAGFEVTQGATHRVGRARLPVSPRDSARVQLSDPLVFDPIDSLPQELAAILPLVHGPARVPHGARVGLYWETYGLAPSEPIETSVSVTPLGAGWLRRVGAWLRLGARPRETRLAWHEIAQPVGGVAGRAVTVDVATLDPGRYRVALSVAARGRTVTASRELEIVAP